MHNLSKSASLTKLASVRYLYSLLLPILTTVTYFSRPYGGAGTSPLARRLWPCLQILATVPDLYPLPYQFCQHLHTFTPFPVAPHLRRRPQALAVLNHLLHTFPSFPTNSRTSYIVYTPTASEGTSALACRSSPSLLILATLTYVTPFSMAKPPPLSAAVSRTPSEFGQEFQTFSPFRCRPIMLMGLLAYFRPGPCGVTLGMHEGGHVKRCGGNAFGVGVSPSSSLPSSSSPSSSLSCQ